MLRKEKNTRDLRKSSIYCRKVRIIMLEHNINQSDQSERKIRVGDIVRIKDRLSGYWFAQIGHIATVRKLSPDPNIVYLTCPDWDYMAIFPPGCQFVLGDVDYISSISEKDLRRELDMRVMEETEAKDDFDDANERWGNAQDAVQSLRLRIEQEYGNP